MTIAPATEASKIRALSILSTGAPFASRSASMTTTNINPNVCAPCQSKELVVASATGNETERSYFFLSALANNYAYLLC